ncbi:MAG: aspartate/glutamate racemase family protein [Actinomycetota bacterium]
MRRALGILGGLGPFASADFLLSIYEHNIAQSEQEGPAVVLYSDPAFPDRTETFLRGLDSVLVEALENALGQLNQCDVSRIVIACVTIHHLLPRVESSWRDKIVSLIDVVLDAVVAQHEPSLLLATNGTRLTHIFEQSDHWSEAAPHVVFPDEADQRQLHDRIYDGIKRNGAAADLVPFLFDLCQKYGVKQCIAGCTELHRVSRHLLSIPEHEWPFQVIDPLLIIARHYKEFVHEQMQPYGRLCRSGQPLWPQHSHRVAKPANFLSSAG